MKDYIKIIALSSFFTVVIFIINYNFFLDVNIENNIAEEKYIETEIKIPKEKKHIIEHLHTAPEIKYRFHYSPKNYQNELNIIENNLKTILEKNFFINKVSILNTYFIKEKIDRRWKMKNKQIKLFWINNENTNEYISVFIHEFAHYIDIYFLEKKVFLDISDKFYKISWESTKVKKLNQTQSDFVSWYSMTNKYEDFAETFTYYVLHNKEFLDKTKKSSILKEKYNFFSEYIFKNKEFFASDFWINKVKNYYRDITKINFNKEKLLEYIWEI